MVDENKELVGIVTEADFLTAIGIPCHHPTHSLWHTLEAMFKQQAQPATSAATVAEIMVQDIITIGEDKTLHEELEGYAAYARQTRFRLLPGIW